jgi:2-dehydro-3-deoxyphosphogluconate aldolase/(4S)-4-hydroxy-2-oxoglutarate aldolase
VTAPGWLPEPPLIAVIRVDDADVLDDDRLRALAEGGIGAVEIALTSGGALGLLRRTRAVLPASVAVGAGTVLEPAQGAAAERAGAEFLASPTVVPALANRAIPTFPGVLSPRDVQTALELGHRTLKLFPARGGPDYLRDLLGPFPGTAFLPSGGVVAEALGEWRRSGAAGAFLGTSLLYEGGRLVSEERVRARTAAACTAWHARAPGA